MTNYWQTAAAEVAAQNARAQRAAAEMAGNPAHMRYLAQRDRIGAEIAKFVAQLNRYNRRGWSYYNGSWSNDGGGVFSYRVGPCNYRDDEEISLSIRGVDNWDFLIFYPWCRKCDWSTGDIGQQVSEVSDEHFEVLLKQLVLILALGLNANGVPIPTT